MGARKASGRSAAPLKHDKRHMLISETSSDMVKSEADRMHEQSIEEEKTMSLEFTRAPFKDDSREQTLNWMENEDFLLSIPKKEDKKRKELNDTGIEWSHKKQQPKPIDDDYDIEDLFKGLLSKNIR